MGVLKKLLLFQKSFGVPEHFVENVYSALQVVAMLTEEEDIGHFLCGSPPKAQRSQGSSAAVGVKKSKSSSKVEGIWTLQVPEWWVWSAPPNPAAAMYYYY